MARSCVRGLAASMSASIHRLNAIAAVRAKTTARMTFPRTDHVGSPSAARNAAAIANGSANTECEILIDSQKTMSFFIIYGSQGRSVRTGARKRFQRSALRTGARRVDNQRLGKRLARSCRFDLEAAPLTRRVSIMVSDGSSRTLAFLSRRACPRGACLTRGPTASLPASGGRGGCRHRERRVFATR